MAALLFSPTAWLVMFGLALSGYGTGRWHQYRHDLKAQAEAKFTESETARLRERAAQVTAQRIADEKEAATRRRISNLTADLERLRNRPDRLPEASAPSCAGASGRELSGPDAAFLVRLADDADRIRDALDACQKREMSYGDQTQTP